MGKNQSASNLTNIIKQDGSGNIVFTSGSTTLATISTSGQLSGSTAVKSATTASYADNFTVTGNLTAQTLIVQTITSSVDYVTGSTRFGSTLANTHVFSGSMLVTGSIGINLSSSAYLTGSLTVQSMVSASTSGPIVAARTSYVNKAIIAELAEYSSDGALVLRHALATSPTVFITSQTGGASHTYFNHDGNISIGTTTPVSTNLKGALTIVKSYSSDTPTSTTAQSYYSNQSALFLFGRNSGVSIISNNNEEGSIIFGNASTNAYASITTGTAATTVGGDMYFKVGSNTERMRITSGGSVGIGTISPTAKLEVKGSGDGDLFIARYSGGSAKLIYGYQSGADGYLELRTGADGIITKLSGYSGTPSYFLSNVLVGQTTPDIGTNGWQLLASGGGHTAFAINNNEAFIFNNRNTGTTYQIDFRTNSVERGSINVTDSGTSYATTSDYRVKEDFKDFNGLEKLTNIKVYDFKFKDLDERMDGVIAHELQEILPYAVYGEKDGAKFQSVDYSRIVPVLIKAIQELNTKLEAANAEIEALKNK